MVALAVLVSIVAVGAGVAVQLAAAGRLPRNGLLGIRTALVLRDDASWVRGHRAAVVPTWATAVVVVCVTAVSVSWEAGTAMLTFVGVGVLSAGALIGSVLATRAAREHPNSNDRGALKRP